jgi:hypothetical protein
MLPGIDVLKNIIFWALASLLCWGPFAAAQDKPVSPALEGQDIYAVVKDAQGEKLEGFLRFDSDEISVRSQDNQEKKIPVKYLKSITLEKSKSEFPGEDQKASNTPSGWKIAKKFLPWTKNMLSA